MTDKVQLIREEIERQIEKGKVKCQQSQENNDYESFVAWSEHVATCGKLLLFINSLPEEPDCEVNCTTKNEDLEREIGRYTTNCLLDKRNHSTGIYHLTQRNCDDIARHFAEWQENKNVAQSCKNLYAAIKENQEKKFFNDDFEKASYAQGMIDGSMWYKQQMKEALQTEYEKGRFDMREEMMKDAIEGEVYKGYVGKQIVISSKDGNAKYVAFDRSYADAFNIGEKVKIIIVN